MLLAQKKDRPDPPPTYVLPTLTLTATLTLTLPPTHATSNTTPNRTSPYPTLNDGHIYLSTAGEATVEIRA